MLRGYLQMASRRNRARARFQAAGSCEKTECTGWEELARLKGSPENGFTKRAFTTKKENPFLTKIRYDLKSSHAQARDAHSAQPKAAPMTNSSISKTTADVINMLSARLGGHRWHGEKGDQTCRRNALNVLLMGCVSCSINTRSPVLRSERS